MAHFRYSGFNAQGRSVAGTIEAPSEENVLHLLEVEGVIPASVERAASGPANALVGTDGDAPAASPVGMPRLSGRVPMSVRTIFVRELATFLNAGVPLLEALGVLRHQENHPAFAPILSEVFTRVQGGESFSKALARHPRIFPPLLVTMSRVGETGGMLGSVLEQMATWMEHDEDVRGEVRGAMAYPVIIVVLGIITVIILMSFVLPRITTIFAGMEAQLPLPTRLLMAAAGFMARWWWSLPVVAIAAWQVMLQILKTQRGRHFFDRLALSIPVFGSLNIKSSIARFARACGALLLAGVPLLEALRVVRGLMPNSILAAVVEDAVQGVTKGQSLARTLGKSPFFPPSVTHLLGVGERTGTLGDMFNRVAQSFEKHTSAQIKILLNLLAPMLIVMLAVLVGFIAISILLPIFKMNRIMMSK